MLIMMTSAVAVSSQATSPLFGTGAGAAVAAGAPAAAGAEAGAAVAAVGAVAAGVVAAGALSCAATAADRPSAAHIENSISNRFIAFPSQRFRAGLAGADAYDLQKIEDEDLSVTDLPRVRGLLDRLDDAIDQVVPDRGLDLDLGQEVDDVLGTPVQLGVTFLAAEPLDLGDRDALDADRRQRLAHLVELERLDDCSDHLHGGSLVRCASERLLDVDDATGLAGVVAGQVGVEALLGIVVGVESAELEPLHRAVGNDIGDADFPVVVAGLAASAEVAVGAVVLDVDTPDVAGQRESAVADRIVGGEVVIDRAVGLLAGRAGAEIVVEAVRDLEADPVPADRAIELEGVGVDHAGVALAGVVVIDAADVEEPAVGADGGL